MLTYLFPGQGSQAKGMGSDVLREFPELVAQADAILGYSIKELCLEDPEQKLNQTAYTQPALFVVNALSYLQRLGFTDQQKPDYVAGHSLGEYNALFAAGVFDFATGVKLVQKRGELMSQGTNGAMAAVIGLTRKAIQTVLTKHNITDVTIANQNSHLQNVLSGPKNLIDKMPEILDEAPGIMMVRPLSVSGAFHSPAMQTAQDQFKIFLQKFKFAVPTIPVIANKTAAPYEPNEIHQTLAEQITHPVRWTESIMYLLSLGDMKFVEVGPGAVLTSLVRRIRNGQ